MSILDKASIITTPTAYEDGKLLSLKPSSALGSQLCTNGTFDTDSDWSKTNATISGGTANFNISSGAYAKVEQSKSYTSGKVYVLTAIVNGTAGKKMRFRDDTANNGGLTSSTGQIVMDGTDQSLEFRFTANANSDTIAIERQDNESDDNYSFTVDNVSLKEDTSADLEFVRGSSATRFNEQRLIEDVSGTNTPRIDFTGGGCPSLLLEPQSTNIVPTSEVTPQSTSNVTTTASFGTSPEGVQNSLKVQKNGVNDNDRIFPISNYNATLVSGNKYSISAFVKNIDVRDTGATTIACRINGATLFRSAFEWDGINISIGSSFTSGTRTNVFANSYGNGWWRIGFTFQADGTSGNFELDVDRRFGTDTTSIETWGWQLEEQSFVSSYIPTSGSAATRLADSASRSGLQDHINSTEGVLYAEMAASDNLAKKAITLISSDNNSKVQIIISADNSTVEWRINSSGTTVLREFNLVSNLDNYNKIAVKWKANDFCLYVNGIEIASVSSGSSIPSNTLSEIILNNRPFGENFYGKVKSLIVFNEALSDTELTALTS